MLRWAEGVKQPFVSYFLIFLFLIFLFLVLFQDPCFAKVNGYEPYEKMKQIKGNIQWPTDAHPSGEYIDTDRSVLGNVS
jgi:hypothetical protein